MGLAGGKMKCPSGDMKFLLEQTKWSKEEIQWRYTNFIIQCPDGKLTFDLLVEQCMMLYRKSQPEKFCEHLIRALDEDGDGTLNFREYMMGSYIWCRGTTDDKLNWAFNLYDVDKSGTIQPQEMEEIMLAACHLLGKRLDIEFSPQRQVTKLMKGEKKDIITREEFFEHHSGLADLVAFMMTQGNGPMTPSPPTRKRARTPRHSKPTSKQYGRRATRGALLDPHMRKQLIKKNKFSR